MNFDLKVKDILKETFILTGEINDKDIIDNLIEFVKNNKDENFSYKTNVKGHFTGFHSLNQNIYFLKFIKNIQPYINKIFKTAFTIKEAWGNICKINEEVTEHAHEGISGFSGILYLSNGGPGTYFKEYDLFIKEKIGKFVLFHPSLWHKVPVILEDIERITIAFNTEEIKNWEDLSKFKMFD